MQFQFMTRHALLLGGDVYLQISALTSVIAGQFHPTSGSAAHSRTPKGGLHMNSHHFQPGQRVLCIDGSFHSSVWEYVDEVPIEGEIYTVSKVRLGGRDNVTGKIGPALGLQEISGSLPGCQGEVCWLTRRFIPLDLQQTKSAEKNESAGTPRSAKSAHPAVNFSRPRESLPHQPRPSQIRAGYAKGMNRRQPALWVALGKVI